jgi:tRNA(fMet)-specific endonuclease VapC
MICLDTNIIIAVISQRAAPVRQRLMKTLHEGTIVGIPTVVMYELWYGIKKSARAQANTDALDNFLALDVTPWPFEPEDAEEASDVRVALERLGTPIGPYDVLIAAQARRRGAILVTANKNEFARVPGLQTQDWTAA